ncbi:MAG TPA: hypothetical protein VG735_08945 [Caulobacterales bacterium]|nr:hypothetical protein [Caulobacterales bacterium]
MVDPYYLGLGGLFLAGLVMFGLNRLDERRWARQKKEEQARSHPAE